MDSLPPDRDLPEAARAAVRARVAAVASTPPARTRRWIPVAAAAGVAAVVAASGAVASARDESHSLTAAATPPAPADSVLLETCRRGTGPGPGVNYPVGPQLGAAVHTVARFDDRAGIILRIADDRLNVALCEFRPGGALQNRPVVDTVDKSYLGYLGPGAGVPVNVSEWGGSAVAGGRYVAGQVERGVAKVVVTFQDTAPITVPLSGGNFVVRTTGHAPDYPLDPYTQLVAYDAGGHELGRSSLNTPVPAVSEPGGPSVPTSSPQPPPGAAKTDPAVMLATCAADLIGGDADTRAKVGTMRLVALLSDQDGYMLAASSTTWTTSCHFDRAGTVVVSGGGGNGPLLPGYEPAGGRPVNGYGSQSASFPGGSAVLDTAGRVRHDVARVDVTWPGGRTTRATISGGVFLARVLVPKAPGSGVVRVTYTSYDASGHRIAVTRSAG
jgi:hypothetical protein